MVAGKGERIMYVFLAPTSSFSTERNIIIKPVKTIEVRVSHATFAYHCFTCLCSQNANVINRAFVFHTPNSSCDRCTQSMSFHIDQNMSLTNKSVSVSVLHRPVLEICRKYPELNSF
ncbi:hypothetical protein CHS0354_014878 [Potamilus streckersoni]|uniref:Uncharacterized protein n=1 Tax=Potamilus streckersoni TaxID=2493646 RepID=A0AAE0TJK8_9BIVA|nr:hypothetical protein CHS0354_014878 [Potamilus streckersoni]